MRKIWVLTLVFAVAMTAAISIVPFRASGQKNKFRRSNAPVAGSYIVVLDEEAVGKDLTNNAVSGEANFLAGTYSAEVDKIYGSAIRGFSAKMSEEAAQNLSEDPRVAYVEEDGLAFASETESGAPWHLDRLDQRSLPLDATYNYSQNGAGAHAYIIDSGIRFTHSEFGGRASFGTDFVGDGQNGNDCYGHGTHVAGLIGGATYGVAKSVSLHSVRVMGCDGTTSISKIVSAIDWVTANRINPAVANISITAAGTSASMETAVTNSIASGVVFTIAAGNSGLNACDYSPGRTPNAITVAASGSGDEFAPFSNYGTCVDLAAPGYAIVSAGITSDTATASKNGTSMSAPIVAGVVAAYRASNPSASPATVFQVISNATTNGVLTGMRPETQNKLLYSWLSGGPAPTPTPTPTPTPAPTPIPTPTPTPAPSNNGRISIRKALRTTTGTPSSTTTFQYQATNIPTPTFTLTDNQEFTDPDVPGSSTTISVTEAAVTGTRLVSVDCVEVAGTTPNIPNTTVDLTNRQANIIVEDGESVTCTFTSEQIAPTSAPASVSGRVLDSRGKGIHNITLSLVNAMSGEVKSATTNSFGYYEFSGLEVMDFYTLTAISTRRYRFGSQRSFTLSSDLVNLDFVASSSGK
ncbi:MAG TPA: S8 family serine peptidase [Pyrinomonadaceae bacterium]|nr:S8 family serine peptidase [Pyrinomonadaceae bacterium]